MKDKKRNYKEKAENTHKKIPEVFHSLQETKALERSWERFAESVGFTTRGF